MRLALLLPLMVACTDKDVVVPTDDSGGSSSTDDTEDTADPFCPDGPGEVVGTLLGSDAAALDSGQVILYDRTGSEELLRDNVQDDGSYRLVYGRGSYVLVGRFNTCIGDEVEVHICGDQTENVDVSLTCAP